MHPNYKSLRLAAGAHAEGSGQGCLLEITSYLYGESWSDHPACVSPSLAAFGRATNDWMNDEERQLLLPFTVRLGNTADSALEQARGFAFADFAVRGAAPIGLECVGLADEAAKLRALTPIVDRVSARAAAAAAAAYAVARAADCAARAAAYADCAARAAAYAADCAAADAVDARATLVRESVALLDRLCPPLPADTSALRWDRTATIVGC